MQDRVEMARLLRLLLPHRRAGKIALKAVQKLGKEGQSVLAQLARASPKTPAQKPNPVFVRPEGIPMEWNPSPSDKGPGMRYRHPKNHHHEVRVQQGDPRSFYPHQQRDYVLWKKHGQWMDKDGNIIRGKEGRESPRTHIPLEEFRFKPEIFK